MSFLDSIGNFLTGGQAPVSNLQDLISGLQPLVNANNNYNNQQQMNNVFSANPEFAAQLYGARNASQSVANQSRQIDNQTAELKLAQEMQAAKLKQQSALQDLASQVRTTPLEKLLALASPGELGQYLTQKQSLDQEKQKNELITNILSGKPPQTGLRAPNTMQSGDNPMGPAPLNVRNNNPGNMRGSDGQFQWYASPEEGIAAMTKDLTAKLSGKSPVMQSKFGKDYVPNLTNVISTWAPPGENDTQGYIDAVAKQTGINPLQPLTVADIGKIMPAMIKQEGGQSAVDHFINGPRQPLQAPQVVTQTSSTLMPPSMSALRAPETKVNPYDDQLQRLDMARQIDPKYNTQYDQMLTKKVAWDDKQEKEQASSANGLITPENEDIQGKAFLDTIEDPKVKEQAQAYLDGRAKPPSTRAQPYQKQAWAVAMHADPTLDEKTFPVRQKTQQDFTTGPEARNVNALNTVINHLGEWDKAVSELHNYGSQYANAASNGALKHFSDNLNGKIKAADTNASAVASEAAKAYRGVGAITEAEQEDWKGALSSNLGPQAQQAVKKQIGTLLLGKIDALNSQWNSAFPNNPKNFLTPKAAKALQDMGIDVSEYTGSSEAAPSTSSTSGWSIRVKQ